MGKASALLYSRLREIIPTLPSKGVSDLTLHMDPVQLPRICITMQYWDGKTRELVKNNQTYRIIPDDVYDRLVQDKVLWDNGELRKTTSEGDSSE